MLRPTGKTGVGVNVGVGVLVVVGVLDGVAVIVGARVIVGIAVSVGPNIWPGLQAVIEITKIMLTTIGKCFISL